MGKVVVVEVVYEYVVGRVGRIGERRGGVWRGRGEKGCGMVCEERGVVGCGVVVVVGEVGGVRVVVVEVGVEVGEEGVWVVVRVGEEEDEGKVGEGRGGVYVGV